ncbi:MAG: ribosome maturation factor RimP [Firmicutes bacterium]|nr:ribosome maturation factor RimP [Bacillota bacterium]
MSREKGDREKIRQLVTQCVAPIAQAKEVELVDVEFVREGGQWFLRVYIDKPGGVAIDDCQAVSEPLSAELDRLDPISYSYTLEVSSPGLERPLRKDADYVKFAGRKIRLTTFEAINGKKEWQGRLIGLVDGEAQVETGSGMLSIPLRKIARANLAVEF